MVKKIKKAIQNRDHSGKRSFMEQDYKYINICHKLQIKKYSSKNLRDANSQNQNS